MPGSSGVDTLVLSVCLQPGGGTPGSIEGLITGSISCTEAAGSQRCLKGSGGVAVCTPGAGRLLLQRNPLVPGRAHPEQLLQSVQVRDDTAGSGTAVA